MFSQCESHECSHYSIAYRSRVLVYLPINSKSLYSGLRFILPTKKLLYVILMSFLKLAYKNKFQLDRDLQRYFSEMGVDYSSLLFVSGSHGAFSKLSVLELAERGEPEYIYKITNNPTVSTVIHNEADILSNLSKYDSIREYIPESRVWGFSEYTVLRQKVIYSTKAKSNLSISRVKQFHQELCSETAVYNKVVESQIYNQVIDGFDQIKDKLTYRDSKIIRNSIEIINDIKNSESRFVMAHRDYAYWNMLVDERSLYIIDWEYSRGGYPELYDLLYFLLMPEAVNNTLTVDRMNEIISKNLNYLLSDTIKLSDVQWQLVIFMLDIVMFYICSNNGTQDVVTHQLIELLDSNAQWYQEYET